jgi:protein-disulfide isomerase
LTTRRYLIAGAGGVVLLGAGAAAWKFFGSPDSKPSEGISLGGAVDLMTPGPLGEQSLGRDDAPVTIVEYASMTCPHCANFHKTTYPALKKQYIDTGKVRFIFRELPLDQIALLASMLARCGGKDKFFSLVEVLFQQQDKWAVQDPLPPLLAIAKQAGFSEDSFNVCVKDQKVYDGVVWSYERAGKLGVKSTPSFFINGKLHAGGMSIEDMAKMIDPLLKS